MGIIIAISAGAEIGGVLGSAIATIAGVAEAAAGEAVVAAGDAGEVGVAAELFFRLLTIR